MFPPCRGRGRVATAPRRWDKLSSGLDSSLCLCVYIPNVCLCVLVVSSVSVSVSMSAAIHLFGGHGDHRGSVISRPLP